MRSLDPFLGKRFDRSDYNCLHLSCDVWFYLTGQDIRERLSGLLNPQSRQPTRHHIRSFHRVLVPVDPCLVLMERPRCAPHVGVYVRGKVIHLHENGVEYQPVDIASRGFRSVRYYT